MPMVQCDNDHRWRWANTRGSRVPEQCQCGAAVYRVSYNYTTAQWERVELKGKTKGRKMEHCAICGRKRSVPGGGKRLEQETTFKVVTHIGGWLTGRVEESQQTVAAGACVCWHHEPNYPVNIYMRNAA